MLMPEPAGGGWSRVAGGLSQEDADRLVVAMLFPARAMPDEVKDES
jgi:hypothetical protein